MDAHSPAHQKCNPRVLGVGFRPLQRTARHRGPCCPGTLCCACRLLRCLGLRLMSGRACPRAGWQQPRCKYWRMPPRQVSGVRVMMRCAVRMVSEQRTSEEEGEGAEGGACSRGRTPPGAGQILHTGRAMPMCLPCGACHDHVQHNHVCRSTSHGVEWFHSRSLLVPTHMPRRPQAFTRCRPSCRRWGAWATHPHVTAGGLCCSVPLLP